MTAKFATAVGAIAGALVATGTAWAFLDLPVVSTRSWTMAQVERLERNLRQQGQILYDIRRGQLERNVIDLEQKSKRNSDEEYRLRALKEDMRRLDTQIDQMGKK
jgi:hypothetical protein